MIYFYTNWLPKRHKRSRFSREQQIALARKGTVGSNNLLQEAAAAANLENKGFIYPGRALAKFLRHHKRRLELWALLAQILQLSKALHKRHP
jgi:hypothetical protein